VRRVTAWVWFGLCRLFKECPHPDDKQRADLSTRLGLEPRQVKFWFENRRTLMKVSTRRTRHAPPSSVKT
jgi:hypothetical protein